MHQEGRSRLRVEHMTEHSVNHIGSSLRSIIGVSWMDRMTNEEQDQNNTIRTASTKLKLMRHRWSGHVNRIPSERLSHAICVLKEGTSPIEQCDQWAALSRK